MLIKRFTAGLLALSMLMGITGCSLPNLRITETADTEKKIVSTKETDMTVADPDSDYGLIYYTPPEEEHIVQLSEDDVMQYIDNEVLLVSNEGVSRDKIFELAEKYDAEVVGEIEVSGDYQLRLNGIYDIDELDSIVDELCDEDIVYDAYPNYVMPYEVEGKIKDINKAWSNNEDNVAWGFNAINAAQAQAELNKPSYKSKPVRVGVVDQGFDIDHEDLRFAEVFYDNGRNGVNNEDKDHGTHVSGTFAATTGNGIGIDGVYPYGKGNLYGISPYGISSLSENDDFFASVMTQKIAYSELIVHNVKVINQSMGFNFYIFANKITYNNEMGEDIPYFRSNFAKWYNDPQSHSKRISDAMYLGDFFRRMLHSGYDFVLVNSAGNDSRKDIGHLESRYASLVNLIPYEYYPEIYDRIIVVSSVGKDYKIAENSNAGERTDIYAPGEKVFSTVSDNNYNLKSGTSMASPHVAGVAAMVWSANNDLTGAQVKEIVCSSISDSSGDHPVVDAYKAVQKAHTTKGKGNADDPNKGAVLGFVVDSFDENIKIKNTEVVFTSVSTGICHVAYTDSDGHFEIALPEGDYYLDVSADGYPTYSWYGGIETIHVSAEEVLYLDWIKMGSINQVSLAGFNWITKPTIEADDILVGDHFDLDTGRDSPYVYIKRDKKYGLIDYYGNIVADVKYDSFNGNDFYGLDSFIAVYDSETGDTVFVQNNTTSKIDNWELVTQPQAYGQPGIGTWSNTYFINDNDGELYYYRNVGSELHTFEGGVDEAFIVQKINYVPSEFGLGRSSATDENFYLYSNEFGKRLTDGYKYVYANGGGYCQNGAMTYENTYTTVTFSNNKKKWDIYDYTGKLIASDLEPFDCNIDKNPWWCPATAFFDKAGLYDSAENTYDQPVPFCATNGYIAAKIGGRCGYLDLEGNTVVDFGIFDDIRPVHNGMAWVRYNGKWGVISFD